MADKNFTQLNLFNPKVGLDRGRSSIWEAFWYISKCIFFLSPLPWPTKLKCTILRLFGAKVGIGVNIKPRVNIHFPWKLELGDWCWIGEEVFILNFEHTYIGSNACVSQRSFLCCGNHNFRDPAFSYKNGPIFVGEQVWIGAQVFVGPGVTIGTGAVVKVGSIVTEDQPQGMICAGNPCISIKPRWKS